MDLFGDVVRSRGMLWKIIRYSGFRVALSLGMVDVSGMVGGLVDYACNVLGNQ